MDLLRNLTLAVPLLAVLAAGLVLVLLDRRDPAGPRRLDARTGAAVFLATAYAWCGVLAVHALPATGGWWAFSVTPTTVLGLPVETSLGWALAWGALPALVGGRTWLWLGGLAWIDALLMPRLAPLVVLEPGWWRGEVVLLLVVAAPALLLARATRERRWLGVRTGLQVVLFTALVVWLLPTLVLARTGGQWAALLDHGAVVRSLLLMTAVVAGVPALAAVVELARVGHGTPFPWDPPDRLVTTGPYAYVANPMQLGACALLVVLAAGTRSWGLLLAAAGAAVFSTVLAERHEQATMARRWPDHAAYRRAVRSWVPRWRPHVPSPADLWLDETCGVCRATADAVGRLGPVGLRVHPASKAGVRLTRARWLLPLESDPVLDRGVAALARAAEQTCLPWAWCGWAVRLPVVVQLLGVVADACGLGPREAGSEAGSEMGSEMGSEAVR